MTIQVTGIIEGPLGSPSPGITIRVVSKISYRDTYRLSTEDHATTTGGAYDFQLNEGFHKISIRYRGASSFVKLGDVSVSDQTPSPISLINLLESSSPKALVVKLQELADEASESAQSASDDADKVALDKQTVTQLAQQVSDDADQVALDKAATAQSEANASTSETNASQSAASAQQSADDAAAIVPSLQSQIDNKSISDSVINNTSDSTDVGGVVAGNDHKRYILRSSVSGLESTPDVVKIRDNLYATRNGPYLSKSLGFHRSPSSLGHRCGDFEYIKHSEVHATLLTNLGRFKPKTNPNLVSLVVYVDPSKPNNSGDGLTWGTAKQSIASALSLNPDIVYIDASEYPRFARIGDLTISKDLAIISVGGIAIQGSLATGSWSKTAGQTNVYQMNYRSGLTNVTNRVYDTQCLDEFGNVMKYAQEGSVADVELNPGSFYHDTANFITYVHAFDGRDLTIGFNNESLRLCQPSDTCSMTFTGNYKVYWEGIEVWGGFNDSDPNVVRLLSDGNKHFGSVFYNKNCQFNGSYSAQGNGLAVRDIAICISEDSQCKVSRRDGFNYHNGVSNLGGGTDLAPHFIELNCFAGGNGLDGSDGNNQGSTSHEDCVGLRINCTYNGHRDGGNVVDIEASKVLNVAMKTSNSNTAGALLSCDSYPPGNPTSIGEWWIDGIASNRNPEPSTAKGDLAMDGFRSRIHMRDTMTEREISTRTFSTPPDDSFS